jgi:hypothetical protein
VCVLGGALWVCAHIRSVNKFLLDDKGTTLIACFGLPPFAHVDDPTRALFAAVQLQGKLLALQLNSAIGMSAPERPVILPIYHRPDAFFALCSS